MNRLILFLLLLPTIGKSQTNFSADQLEDWWRSSFAINDTSALEEISTLFLDHANQTSDPKTLGIAWYRIAWVKKLQNDYSDRVAAYKKSANFFIEANESSFAADVYYNLGVVFFDLGEYQKSIDYLNQALAEYEKVDVEDYQVYEYLGKALLKIGHTDLASAFLNKAYKNATNPSHKGLISNQLGNLFYLQEDYSHAKTQWINTIDTYQDQLSNENLAWVYSNLALANVKLGELISAEENFKSSLFLTSYSDPGPYLNYGDWLEAEGRVEEALYIYRDFLENHAVNLKIYRIQTDFESVINKSIELSTEISSVQDFELYTKSLILVRKVALINSELAHNNKELIEIQNDEIIHLNEEIAAKERLVLHWKLAGFVLLSGVAIGLALYTLIKKRNNDRFIKNQIISVRQRD